MGTILNAEERKDLLVRHSGERDGRVSDRIKAMLLRDDGMSCGEIARVLFLSDEGVRQQIEDYLRQNRKIAA
jgi:predicted ArsR family transcriptional regulator